MNYDCSQATNSILQINIYICLPITWMIYLPHPLNIPILVLLSCSRAITEDPPDGISASLEDDSDLCV